MEIKEIQNIKHQLEKEIYNLLNSFEIKTELSIEELIIKKIGDKDRTYLIDFKIEVRI